MIHRFTISKPEPLFLLKQYSQRMVKGNWWKILKDQKTTCSTFESSAVDQYFTEKISKTSVQVFVRLGDEIQNKMNSNNFLSMLLLYESLECLNILLEYQLSVPIIR